MAITQAVLDHTSKWMATFTLEWHTEIPQKIHSREFAADGTHQWHPEFKSWLDEGRKSQEHRRLTQAMRRLRRQSIREFEVAYRMIAQGEQIDQTTRWLNDRAIRNNKPERYEIADTQVIIVSAVDKLLAWY